MKQRKNYQAQYLREALTHPDWYAKLRDYLNDFIFPIVHDDPKLKAKRYRFYELVEEILEEDKIPLAQTGPDLDLDRKPIDTIVIHHTEEEPDIRLSKLSAIGFVRQYAKTYLEDKDLRGQPIWSGHFKDGKMVFFAYHWLIRPNGLAERLLEDHHIGRQSHRMNPRSIGIAFSGNYEHSTPPLEQIKSAGKIIRSAYPFVRASRIFGHREVMEDRTCPGDKFLGGWKETLLTLIKA